MSVLDDLLAASYSHLMFDTEEEYQSAIRGLTQILAEDPFHVAALNNRGVAYWEIGERDLAVADFDLAIEHSGADPVPHSNRAALLRETAEIAVQEGDGLA